MSVRTMARVWESSQHGGSDLLMLLAIADFADDEGNAYPAVSTLAAKCRMKPRNCQYLLRSLEESGELLVVLNAGPNGANLYRINLGRLGVQHSAGVQSLAGVQHSARGGAKLCAKGVQPVAYKPSVNHQEPSTMSDAKKTHRSSRVESAPDFFSEFWDAYGKKNGKANSIKEWKKIKPEEDTAVAIIAAAKVYASSREQQYRKDPERWLKGRMWEDEPPADVVKAGMPSLPKAGETRQRHGVPERFDEVAGWVPA